MKSLRPTPSSVIAVFAVIVAMSGTAVASSHITAVKIKKHSISGNQLKNNTLGGKQINESKLGVVPLAAAAGSVDGVSMVRVHSIVPSGGAETTIATFGRLKINFGCNASTNHTQLDAVSAFTTGDATSVVAQNSSVHTAANDDFKTGDSIDLTNTGNFPRVDGDLSVAWSDGHYTNFHFTDDFPPIFTTVQSCIVAGVITFA